MVVTDVYPLVAPKFHPAKEWANFVSHPKLSHFKVNVRDQDERYPRSLHTNTISSRGNHSCANSVSFAVLHCHISAFGCEIFSSSARNLGFYITDDMSVELYIRNDCQSAYSELRHISTIRYFISVDSTKNTCRLLQLARFKLP